MANHVWRPYCQMKTAPLPIEIAATDGFELVTADGRRLIDGMASWWSACHGYGHPHIVESVAKQLHRMPHVMFGGTTHESAERLANRLVSMLPGDLNHVFYADSGSVAIEVAMKMAAGYWRRHGHPNRTRFVAFEHAYHGDTTGAMSLCDPDRSMHASYGNAILQQIHCPLPRDEETTQRFQSELAKHRHEIAGVFIEPLVQGAGGMRFHDPETVLRVRQLCDQYGLLMIADEIATGFGRTGTMFAINACERLDACERFDACERIDACDVIPDIICLGKALTAGTMTMAVAVANERVFEAFWSDDLSDAFMHGPTFMANPLACAAANASLDLFEREPRVAQAAEMEAQLRTGLEPCRSLPGVVDVRCRGAIGVVQVDSLSNVELLRRRFIDQGVWLRPFGDCIYATPPLNLPANQVAKICNAIQHVLARNPESGRKLC